MDAHETAQSLREAFDEAFARPHAQGAGQARRLVLALAAGRAVALDMAELVGVTRAGRVVAVAGAPEGLLGVTGVRGRLFPVWRLGALLGADGPPGAEAYLALLQGVEPLALSLDQVEGLIAVPEEALRPSSPGAAREHVRCHLSHGGAQRPLLSLDSIRQSLTRRVAGGGTSGGPS